MYECLLFAKYPQNLHLALRVLKIVSGLDQEMRLAAPTAH